MNHFARNRRSFLRKSAGIAAVGALTPYVFTAADPCSGAVPSKNDQKPLTLGTCYVPASEIRAVLRQAVGGDILSTKHHLCTGS